MPDDRHSQAFELYASLGDRGTYRLVANQLGVAPRTVRHWAKQENWHQRLQERLAQAARQVSDQSVHTLFTERERDLKIVRMAKMKLAKDIADGRVKGKIGDLEMLIRLEAELVGEESNPLMALLHRLPEEVRVQIYEVICRRLRVVIDGLQSPPQDKPVPAASPP